MPTNRCFATTWLAALLAGTVGLAQRPSPDAAPAPFRRPELVAIAWASPKPGPNPESIAPSHFTAWRPDHTAIGDDEINQLKKELREFGTPGRIEDDTLPPLHLVFRIDERARDSQTLTPGLLIDQRHLESRAAQDGSSPNHLALAVVMPSRQALTAWPAEIDLVLQVPIDETSILKTVKQIPESPVDLDPGVRLFWAKVAGMNRSGQKVFPAVGLSVDRDAQPLAHYDFVTHLADGTAESFNSSQIDGTREIHISPPLESKESIDHIDVTRLRYRIDTYRKIPIFPERIPGQSLKPTP
ncbi:MAG TPA: hypothetical protein VM510_13415 [Caulifigura sp.]|nr:hypothetical protein [Caulifigura sp.]